jgi:23S rRNA (uracil1939-C5)-methyltransferase
VTGVFETEIRDTAYGGYGVGTLEDGRVVFIPHTVKGDVVSFSITEDKTNFVYGTAEKIIKPSELRGEEYCPHVGQCGGCVFGHIAQENQEQIKLGFLKTALDRNKIECPEPTIIGGDMKEFRNRATFRIRDGRIGFFKFKTNDFIPVTDCPVIKRSMVEKAIQTAANISEDTTLYITENEENEAIGRLDVSVESRFGFAGLKTGDKMLGTKNIFFKTKYGRFYANHNSFLQGNRHLAHHLQDFVYENAVGKNALELYCGAGFLTLPLAQKCEQVDAVENFAPSIRLAEKAGLKNVKWHVAPSERIGRITSRKYDTIVADPPRIGMDKSVCKFIKESGAERVIYISCDPNTCARDIARLSDKYSVTEIKAVDMFPGSYHVETLALLNKVK